MVTSMAMPVRRPRRRRLGTAPAANGPGVGPWHRGHRDGYSLGVARILLAMDGSDVARHAADCAVPLLGSAHDFTIVRVVPPPAPVAIEPGVALGPAVTPAAAGEVTTEALVAEAEAEVAATARAIGVDAAQRVLVGDPGPELCRLAATGATTWLWSGHTVRGSSSACCWAR
jgi:Universal stress protein family